MPEQEVLPVSSKNDSESSGKSLNSISESFIAHAMTIMNANQYVPTQAQVDKMLSLQEKGMDYTHNERTHFSPSLISSIIVVIFFSILIIGLFVFCTFYAPQYASQVISVAIGLITGGVGGYGYGSKNKKNTDE